MGNCNMKIYWNKCAWVFYSIQFFFQSQNNKIKKKKKENEFRDCEFFYFMKWNLHFGEFFIFNYSVNGKYLVFLNGEGLFENKNCFTLIKSLF